eukprot:COSAG05_NODE_22351_length_265_cov_0.903614_2_plen_61_part_01
MTHEEVPTTADFYVYFLSALRAPCKSVLRARMQVTGTSAGGRISFVNQNCGPKLGQGIGNV